MVTGEVIGDRFELQACAGVGGMGSVYRAIDRGTNRLVALKVLHEVSEGTTIRFAKEAEALAALEHPHIVRYVAHGFAASGEPYLAMEWLEGEELEARLGRERLGIEASVDLGLRVARALALATSPLAPGEGPRAPRVRALARSPGECPGSRPRARRGRRTAPRSTPDPPRGAPGGARRCA